MPLFRRLKGKIVVFGDSLARGVVYDEDRRRYRISDSAAAALVADRAGVPVLNRARMGMTVKDGFLAVGKDLENGIVKAGDTVFLEFGGNDADFDWNAISRNPDAVHAPRVPLSEYENTLTDTVRLLRRNGVVPVMTTLPPVLAERYFAFFSDRGLSRENILHWLGDVNKIYRFHERYSLIATRVARRLSCFLFDLRSAFLDMWDAGAYFCIDGIHPNDAGQRLMFESIGRSMHCV